MNKAKRINIFMGMPSRVAVNLYDKKTNSTLPEHKSGFAGNSTLSIAHAVSRKKNNSTDQTITWSLILKRFLN